MSTTVDFDALAEALKDIIPESSAGGWNGVLYSKDLSFSLHLLNLIFDDVAAANTPGVSSFAVLCNEGWLTLRRCGSLPLTRQYTGALYDSVAAIDLRLKPLEHFADKRGDTYGIGLPPEKWPSLK